MRQLFTLLLMVFAIGHVNAAMPAKFNTKQLSVTWEVIANDQPKKGQSINQVTITNNGKETLPAAGWKLYFNSARMIEPATPSNNGKIDFLNGDLFRFVPDANFGELKPGVSVKIQFVADDLVVNVTDGPEGFYIVWDDEPEKGYNLGAFSAKPYKPDYAGLVTPAVIYDQNKFITDVPESQLTKILPTPVSYNETGGTFKLTSKLSFTAMPSDHRFEKEAALLKEKLAGFLSAKFSNNETDAPTSAMILFDTNIKPEGYKLHVTPQSISITASTPVGAFYGIQSLLSLIPPSAYAHKQKAVEIPCVDVIDEPRFGYRAFMLDVGRNFHPKEEVFKVIDLMALYKLNTLHMHLTEDEGWRLQIPSLPELTEVGGRRGHTLDARHFLPPSHGSGGDVNNTVGTGFYTREDYIEILKYATVNHITVLTEIETPGHARAAIKAMNARYDRLMAEGKPAEAEKYLLYSRDDQSAYSSNQYWNDNVMDVSLPSVYNFISTVVDDISAMYKDAGAPLSTIHFGGDEVPAHVWEKSPAYLTLTANHPEIESTNDLWYYFYGRVYEILKARNLSLAGWEEMALRKTMLDGQSTYVPNPDFSPYHLQTEVWNNTLGEGNEDLAYRLANAGYKVVLSAVTNLYLDMAHYKAFNEPGYYWGAFVDMDKLYGFIPYDYFKNSKVDKNGLPLDRRIFIGKQRLTDYGKSNIMGIQSALWGENIKTNERLEYMITPRILGFAERAWAQDPAWATEKDQSKADDQFAVAYNNFLNVIGKRELPRLAYLNGGFNYRIPQPGVNVNGGQVSANIQYPGLTIHYTTNGTEPTAKSAVYTGPLNATGTVKFRAFDVKGRGSNVSEAGN